MSGYHWDDDSADELTASFSTTVPIHVPPPPMPVINPVRSPGHSPMPSPASPLPSSAARRTASRTSMDAYTVSDIPLQPRFSTEAFSLPGRPAPSTPPTPQGRQLQHQTSQQPQPQPSQPFKGAVAGPRGVPGRVETTQDAAAVRRQQQALHSTAAAAAAAPGPVSVSAAAASAASAAAAVPGSARAGAVERRGSSIAGLPVSFSSSRLTGPGTQGPGPSPHTQAAAPAGGSSSSNWGGGGVSPHRTAKNEVGWGGYTDLMGPGLGALSVAPSSEGYPLLGEPWTPTDAGDDDDGAGDDARAEFSALPPPASRT